MVAMDQHHLSVQDRWHNWIDAESRRRLLAACFFSDGHAAIYQQQRRAQETDAGSPAELQLIPLLGRSAKLWEASSAEEWVNVLAADPGALQPDHVPALDHLTREDVLRRPPIDRMVILSVLAQRLPRRQRPPPAASLSANNSPTPEMDSHMQHVGSQFGPDQQPPVYRHHTHQSSPQLDPPTHYPFDAEERINALFPDCPIAHTYLALHHTPLRDLLAVGGDSWVFSQKVLPATCFHEHQKRLKMWVTATTPGTASSLAGLSVARATIYAARAILGFLDREPHHRHRHPQQPYPPQHHGAAPPPPSAAWSADMSDYWAMYVCALICWAFCHPARGVDGGLAAAMGSSGGAGGGSGGNSPAAAGLMPPMASASRPASGGNPLVVASTVVGDEEAVRWLRMVAAEGVRVEDVLRARGLREAGGVVGLVRRRLESDCVGGRSRLYVDAVGVLRKVEDGVGWKWF